MVWKIDAPQGNEARKVRFDVLPYLHSGIDLGCGPFKVFPHLIGIDSTKDTHLFGTAMRPDLVVQDCARLALFADGVIESIFSSHLLEHIADHKAALREWWRVLKTRGYLVLYLPHADLYPRIGQPGSNPDHKHDFLPADIVQAMEEVAPDWSLLVNEERGGRDEYSFLQVYRKQASGHGQRHEWVKPPPEKTAAIVRVGGHGDALWASSPIALLKEQGYHITAYVAVTGGEILRHDPHIDDLKVLPTTALTDEELLAYWAHEAPKYDRFINLVGSVETFSLAHDTNTRFYLPHALRHKLMNVNYLESVHTYADVPFDFRQKFYPSPEEHKLAGELRAKLPGPLVVIAPAGSGAVKYWPHGQRLMELLAERGVYSVALGDIRDPKFIGIDPYGSVVGMDWPVRVACAFALLSDAVVATESLIANAVAFEPMLKVVTLSHSSNENLTKHWTNTAAIEPKGVACHPCHRILGSFQFCSRDTVTGASACQATVTADTISEFLFERLGIEEKEAAHA